MLFVLMVIALPIISFAQGVNTDTKVCGATVEDVGDVLCKVGSILRTIIPVLILLGVVYFVWGVVTYVIGNDEEAKKRGKDRIIYGLIGFVVIFALEGLIMIVINTFGLDFAGSELVTTFVNNNTSVTEANITGACWGNYNNVSHPKLGDLLNYITCLINDSIIPLIFSLSVVMFIWGVVQYVINSDEEAKKEKGKQFMIWGIIALTVMISVWGLVQIVGDTFKIDTKFVPQLKQ